MICEFACHWDSRYVGRKSKQLQDKLNNTFPNLLAVPLFLTNAYLQPISATFHPVQHQVSCFQFSNWNSSLQNWACVQHYDNTSSLFTCTLFRNRSYFKNAWCVRIWARACGGFAQAVRTCLKKLLKCACNLQRKSANKKLLFKTKN